MNRFFHREFLAQPDDDSTSASIIARVAQTESDYLSAGVLLSDGYEKAMISFTAFKEEEVDDMVRRANTLAEIMTNFAKAVKTEAADVKKAIGKRKQETDNIVAATPRTGGRDGTGPHGKGLGPGKGKGC